MALGFELDPQRGMVVDLAVVGDRDRAILVAHRLMTRRREINDREPAVAERDALPELVPSTAVVRSAMKQRVRHAPHEGLADSEVVGQREDPRYPHIRTPQLRRAHPP